MPNFPVFRNATCSAESGGTSGAWVFIGDLYNVGMQLSPGAAGAAPSCTLLVEATLDQADSSPACAWTAVTTPGYSRITSFAVATQADMSAFNLMSAPNGAGAAIATLQNMPFRFVRLKLNTVSQGTPLLRIFGYLRPETDRS